MFGAPEPAVVQETAPPTDPLMNFAADPTPTTAPEAPPTTQPEGSNPFGEDMFSGAPPSQPPPNTNQPAAQPSGQPSGGDFDLFSL